jgi:hypothetical protein
MDQGGSGGRHEASAGTAPGAGQRADGDPLTEPWHGPSATGGSAAAGQRGEQPDSAARGDGQGEVPAQRGGEHERHGVRGLADRLLGRNG